MKPPIDVTRRRLEALHALVVRLRARRKRNWHERAPLATPANAVAHLLRVPVGELPYVRRHAETAVMPKRAMSGAGKRSLRPVPAATRTPMNDSVRAPEDPRLIADGRSNIRLRDLFAAAALSGLLAHGTDETETWAEIAETAFRIADAMVSERKLPR
jgi:hypothetical protein